MLSPDAPPRVVVIDNGSHTIKAGYAGEHAPRAFFPTMVGEPRNPGVVIATGDHEFLVGNLAQERRGCLLTNRPVVGGVVQDWRDMERLWNHAFYNELKIPPENQPVLMTEPPLNPAHCRERTTELLFESFGVPGLYLAVSSVTSLYAAGLTTGVVVDSGRDVTLTVPVFEGYTLTRHIHRSNIAGQAVTERLLQLLADRGYNFTTANELDIVNYIKETICYVSTDPDVTANAQRGSDAGTPTFSGMNGNTVRYPLPDGQDIVLNEERFLCTEPLFTPAEEQDNISKRATGDENGCGVDRMCFGSIGKCDTEIRKEMYKAVVLGGGTTLFSGFGARLADGLHSLYKHKYPNEPVISMKVIENAERMYAGWLGASMMGVLQMFPKMWISRSDYSEFGPSIVHSKCF
eukprot:TRINITY_DN29174_c0_g1_i1.p1 TRINITY_DN29174_c0_g1~~TRINITY_DN29174_c0_g1_i1.p1  ORF type:complete len:414 (-),score=51.89 TRINITY_DN29174_c0_g1_i1:39-1253(-)